MGAAFNLEQDESGTDAGPQQRRLVWTLDASLQFGGANLFVAFTAQHMTADGIADLDHYGFIIQGGGFICENWELFARYEWGDLDNVGASDLSILTIGLNRYFHGHTLKWTTDVGIGLNEVTSDWVQINSGWQADAPGEDGQIVIRTQLQLLF